MVPTEALSLPAIVKAVALKTGTAIAYQQPGEDAYRTMLLQAGLDEKTAVIFSQVCRAMREGALDVAGDAFERRLGRRPESIAGFIERMF